MLLQVHLGHLHPKQAPFPHTRSPRFRVLRVDSIGENVETLFGDSIEDDRRCLVRCVAAIGEIRQT